MHSRNRQARQFQYRIKSLLLTVLVVATLLAVWKTLVEPFQLQRRAARYFREVGADVTCEPRGPRWVRAIVGDDNLSMVTHISMPRVPNDATGVDEIGVIIRPPDKEEGATLERHAISQQGLELLPQLTHLTTLEMAATNLGDARLQSLRLLTKLEKLDVSYTNVSDDSLPDIGELKSLRILKLEGLTITDLGLRHLTELHCVESLSLSETRLSNSGLQILSKMPRLSTLEIDATRINDKGLEYLAPLVGLKRLSVKYTDVTDRGLSFLGSLKELAVLEVRGTAVSFDGIAALQAQLPQLTTDMDDIGHRIEFFRKLRDHKQDSLR